MAGHITGKVIARTNALTVDGALCHNTNTAFSAELGLLFLSINNQVVDDPRIAADGYHLKEDSVAIGQGVLTKVFTDIDGDGRLWPPARGVDEYVPFKQLPRLISNRQIFHYGLARGERIEDIVPAINIRSL